LLDLGHDACADGAAALADREAQPLLHRDRRDQLDRHLRVVPRHHHLHPPPSLPPPTPPPHPTPKPPPPHPHTPPPPPHLSPPLHLAPLDPPRRHRPPPPNRKHILHRHQKRLVHLPLRNRHVPVQRLQQLPNLPHRPRLPLQRPQRRPPYHRHIIPRILVLRQQLPHLPPPQIHQLPNIHLILLPHTHHTIQHTAHTHET